MTPKRVIGEAALELAERLAVAPEQHVQQPAPRRVGEGLEHRIHDSDYM